MAGQQGEIVDQYARDIIAEGKHWDNFVADRLLLGEIPGSVDFRLFFTQLRYEHSWQPPCIGPVEINFRRREIRYIIETAVRQRGARVLELGCGAGWLSLELARQGAHVTAVDISPVNLELGRYMVETNSRNFPYLYQKFVNLPCRLEEFGSVEFAQADLNSITLPTHEFDAVVVMDSLHHLAQVERLLEQVRGALKLDGLFIGVDHSVPTSRTHNFNAELLPLIEDTYEWLRQDEAAGLVKGLLALARQQPWGLFEPDYDVTPIPGCGPFLEQVRSEMLDIVGRGLGRDLTREAQQSYSLEREYINVSEDISPFEDVSAERLINTLLQEFHASRFETICPFILQRTTIPRARTPDERLLQHYLSALLIAMGERSISRRQTDGQWFLFCLTPSRPQPGDHLVDSVMSPPALTQIHIQNLEQLIEQLRTSLDQRQAHVNNLEAIIEEQSKSLREKNEHIRALEAIVSALQ